RCRAELLNKRFDRLRVEGLRTGFIHESCIQGTDFCSIRAGASLDAVLAVFEDIADTRLHDIIQNPIPLLARSGAMRVRSYQAPLAYRKKSSPGLVEESMPVRSNPHGPYSPTTEGT